MAGASAREQLNKTAQSAEDGVRASPTEQKDGAVSGLKREVEAFAAGPDKKGAW